VLIILFQLTSQPLFSVLFCYS